MRWRGGVVVWWCCDSVVVVWCGGGVKVRCWWRGGFVIWSCRLVSLFTGSAAMPADALAGLCAEILGVKWFGNDHTVILDAMRPQSTTLPPGKRRRSQQHWSPQILGYATRQDHELLSNPDIAAHIKIDRIINVCMDLGLRCPSEQTMKYICSWWQVVSHSPSALGQLSTFDKMNFLATAKRQFDLCRRRAPEPHRFCEQLPVDPVEFLRDSPELYRCKYRSDAEVPTQPTLYSPQAIECLVLCKPAACERWSAIRGRLPAATQHEALSQGYRDPRRVVHLQRWCREQLGRDSSQHHSSSCGLHDAVRNGDDHAINATATAAAAAAARAPAATAHGHARIARLRRLPAAETKVTDPCLGRRARVTTDHECRQSRFSEWRRLPRVS